MSEKNGRFEKGFTPWNVGKKKTQDLNEIRKCTGCGNEKILTEFVKSVTGLYRNKCKECKNKARRTGKISETRFKTGQKSPGVTYKKGNIPWYKQKGLPAPRQGRVNLENQNRFDSFRYKEWKRQVLELKGKYCAKCGCTEKLAVHHIVPWKEDVNLRFEVSNGMPLCASCHGKMEGFKKFHKISNKTSGKKVNKLKLTDDLITLTIRE